MILCTPLVPKSKDGVLRVVLPSRISTPGQDEQNIDARQDVCESWLRQVYSGPVDVRRLGEQASGWLANRDSMVVVEELIKSGECDLVLATELREIYRNPAFHWKFAQDCVDNDVRLVLISDVIDTADKNWERMMHFASLRHGMTVPEVRERVRDKASYSFSRGGMVQKVRYGYRKLTQEEAASGKFGTPGLRIAKLSECTPTIKRIKDFILRDDSYVAIADRFNDEGIKPGPYVEGGKWTDRVVKALMRDPILSGRRQFRVRVSQLHYETGKPRRDLNPTGPEEKEYPELAHLTPEEHAEVLAVMDAREQESKAGQRKGRDSPLWRKPRKRSLWPGQHAVCAVCGGLMYRYGDFLRCENTLSSSARDCWNHVQVKYTLIYEKVLPWVVSFLDEHPIARGKIVDVAWQEFEEERRRRRRTGSSIDERLAQLTTQHDNVRKAIRIEPLKSLVADLATLEKAITEALAEKRMLDSQVEVVGEFTSREDVADRLGEIVMRLARTSFDFADLMRRLLPVFVIQPVQALKCPQMRPRAKLTLRLDAWCEQGETVPERSVTLDLFEPPDRIEYLDVCVEAKRLKPKQSLRSIASELGIGYMTVKRALAYHRLMEQAGATDPYRELHQRPEQASRWTQPR